NETSDAIIENYFTPVHANEAENTRMINRYIQRAAKLKLSRKVSAEDKKLGRVSESEAVQILGEAQGNIAYLEKAKKHGSKLAQREGKTLEEWKQIESDLWENNPQLQGSKEKIQKAILEFRAMYDELITDMNRVRVLNGYPAIPVREGYFPHFTVNDVGGFFNGIAKFFGMQTEVAELPTEIAGKTKDFKPGIHWFGAALERKGFYTDYDALYGFEKYLRGAAEIIYHTDDLQRLRALAYQIRFQTTSDEIRKRIEEIKKLDIGEDEKEAAIKKLYDEGGYALSGFVQWLEEYTNILAGKKSELDRGTERAVGRAFYNFSKALEGRVAANQVGLNVSSALTNFIPLTQAWGTVGSRDLLYGMWQTIRNFKQGDGFAERSDFLTNRFGTEHLVQTGMEKVSDAAGFLMNFIDEFTSTSLMRARVAQNMRKGLSEDAAMHEANAWCAGLMADRSLGAMPNIYYSRNFLLKPFTMFQVEVKNQYSYLFKDMPRGFGEKEIGKLILA
ncbi:MAG: hypothetical protein ACI4RV_01620, partial [Eubacteriales bacterium]